MEWNTAVMKAFFQRSEDIGRVEVLAGLAPEAGLDAEEVRAALTNRTFADHTMRMLMHATGEMGVMGVPLFVIGDRRMSGVQPAERIRAAIELAEQEAKAAT